MGYERVRRGPAPAAAPATTAARSTSPVELSRDAVDRAVVQLLRSPVEDGVVRREVAEDEDRRAGGQPAWSSTYAPGVFFPTRNLAAKFDRAAQRREAHEAWAADREPRANAGAGMDAVAAAAPRRGISKSADATYPDRALVHASPEALRLLATYVRKTMGKPERLRLIEHARGRDAGARTAQDEVLIAAPATNMRDANISMNHKLADSSVMAICGEIVAVMRRGALGAEQETALRTWAVAMCGADAPLAVTMLHDAADQDDLRRVRVLLKDGIDVLSLGIENVRFGDAKVNTRILYGFDGNYDSGGWMTPLTGAIFSAVHGLADAGLINPAMTVAALAPTRDKDSDEVLTSSRALGGGASGPAAAGVDDLGAPEEDLDEDAELELVLAILQALDKYNLDEGDLDEGGVAAARFLGGMRGPADDGGPADAADMEVAAIAGAGDPYADGMDGAALHPHGLYLPEMPADARDDDVVDMAVAAGGVLVADWDPAVMHPAIAWSGGEWAGAAVAPEEEMPDVARRRVGQVDPHWPFGGRR